MPEKADTSTPRRVRRQGQRMDAAQRKLMQGKFLEAFARTSNILAACQHVGIDRTLVYKWKEHDDEFMLQFNQANLDANDRLYGEAWRRAVQGDEEYVVNHGQLVYGPDGKPLTTRKRSDRLLELLLKARLPEFRDKTQVEHSGSIDVSGAKEILLQRLMQIEETKR